MLTSCILVRYLFYQDFKINTDCVCVRVNMHNSTVSNIHMFTKKYVRIWEGKKHALKISFTNNWKICFLWGTDKSARLKNKALNMSEPWISAHYISLCKKKPLSEVCLNHLSVEMSLLGTQYRCSQLLQ
jgi:hypothetical protein